MLENVRHVVVQRGATHDGPWQARATLSPAIQMRFEDADVMPGETSWYRVAWARRNGSVETSAPLEVVHARFTRTALTGAYEASDGGVHVRFALAEAANVQLEVYSAKGRRVAVIETSHRPAGQSLIVWEPRDERGRRVPRGIYFVRLTTNGIAHTRKLALVR